ncbi:MAG: carboxymuconolactone decarboxylase family protein [Candidatus Eremiobacteraeota bacterium]|nr:carboxymuconolactone decarboxylase family protein [Candidatus Eremiobacteraeota bacterium]
MARLPAREPDEVIEAARQSGFFRVLANAPEIAQTLQAHLDTVMGEGRVPRRLKELCAVLVSALNQCEYCLTARREEAERLGVEPAVLRELHDYARSNNYSDAEKAALAATIALTREPRALPVNLWEDMRAHFDAAQIVELLAVVGLFNDLNRLNNALEIG